MCKLRCGVGFAMLATATRKMRGAAAHWGIRTCSSAIVMELGMKAGQLDRFEGNEEKRCECQRDSLQKKGKLGGRSSVCCGRGIFGGVDLRRKK